MDLSKILQPVDTEMDGLPPSPYQAAHVKGSDNFEHGLQHWQTAWLVTDKRKELNAEQRTLYDRLVNDISEDFNSIRDITWMGLRKQVDFTDKELHELRHAATGYEGALTILVQPGPETEFDQPELEGDDLAEFKRRAETETVLHGLRRSPAAMRDYLRRYAVHKTLDRADIEDWKNETKKMRQSFTAALQRVRPWMFSQSQADWDPRLARPQVYKSRRDLAEEQRQKKRG